MSSVLLWKWRFIWAEKSVFYSKMWVQLTNRQNFYWDCVNILRSLQGMMVKVTSVHRLMWKNTNWFFIFQDRSITDV